MPRLEYRGMWPKRRSAREASPVHGKGLAGHVRGLVRCEEQDRLGDFVRSAGALEWNVLEEGFLILLRPRKSIKHRRFDRARGDRIDSDPRACRFERGGLGESFHGMLARHVDRGAGKS